MSLLGFFDSVAPIPPRQIPIERRKEANRSSVLDRVLEQVDERFDPIAADDRFNPHIAVLAQNRVPTLKPSFLSEIHMPVKDHPSRE